MSEYTFEFPNMNATLAGKDGQDITEEQTLFQETYEGQGWLFEYGEEGFYRYHWEIDDGLPYIVFINEIEVFPNHDNTINGKDGQDASIFDLIEKETYENNNWDFNEIWELPPHNQEEGIFHLPNLQGLEHSYLHEELVSLFAFVIYVYNKHNDEIISIDIYILMQTGTIVIKPTRFKGYEAFEKEKQVVIDELGKSIDVVFNYYIKPQHLSDVNIPLSLTIASIDKKRDRYKVQNKLLSGQYVIQTIDTGRNIYNIRFYATAEQKQKLDELYSTAEEVELIKNLEITKLKIKNLNWNIFTGGNYEERIYVGQMEATEVTEVRE